VRLPQVLAHDARNAKALFRRGRARLALRRTEDALADLAAAAAAAPGDGGIARELAAARAARREERAAEARRGAFARAQGMLKVHGCTTFMRKGWYFAAHTWMVSQRKNCLRAWSAISTACMLT